MLHGNACDRACQRRHAPRHCVEGLQAGCAQLQSPLVKIQVKAAALACKCAKAAAACAMHSRRVDPTPPG